MTRYLITDPLLYGSDAHTLCHTLKTNLSVNPADFACLRDKQTKEYAKLAGPFIVTAGLLGVKSILHSYWQLAVHLGADGVHFGSQDIAKVTKAKESGLFVIVSTHTKEEALEAEALGADAITFSPIFETPGKGNPVGLVKLKEIIDTISIQCYALGGIVEENHILKCQDVGAHGFASIRYFCP